MPSPDYEQALRRIESGARNVLTVEFALKTRDAFERISPEMTIRELSSWCKDDPDPLHQTPDPYRLYAWHRRLKMEEKGELSRAFRILRNTNSIRSPVKMSLVMDIQMATVTELFKIPGLSQRRALFLKVVFPTPELPPGPLTRE